MDSNPFPLPSSTEVEDIPLIEQPTVLDFFKEFSAYHIMPTSAKILSIDSKTTVYKAFKIMNDNLVSSAYIWDREIELYKCVLTATDIMKACIAFHYAYFAKDAQYSLVNLEKQWNQQTTPTLIDLLSHVSIESIKNDSIKLEFVQTINSLQEAIEKMLSHHIHRLPILDNDGSVIGTLTYRSICRFLVSKFRFHSDVLGLPILNTGIVKQDVVVTIRESSTALEAIQVLVKNTLSVVPILNDDGDLIDVYSKYDFANSDLDLDMTVTEAIKKRHLGMEGLVTAPKSSTVGHILRMIADNNLHRMILVEDTNPKKLVGVVSLRHVLKFLTEENVYDTETTRERSVSESIEGEIGAGVSEDDTREWEMFEQREDD